MSRTYQNLFWTHFPFLTGPMGRISRFFAIPVTSPGFDRTFILLGSLGSATVGALLLGDGHYLNGACMVLVTLTNLRSLWDIGRFKPDRKKGPATPEL